MRKTWKTYLASAPTIFISSAHRKICMTSKPDVSDFNNFAKWLVAMRTINLFKEIRSLIFQVLGSVEVQQSVCFALNFR
ncbi:hypothetical protein ARMGADRAFT_340938 [Armillaria gallica]|uniref:Uncharacterized protein n=1 Tax=Armillaria gallica TaxID=47427 RepID=A0A2H3DD25_ARMGA|nr:hypothetical protein ARMGADRAFT_340938 [Armillaria gallica]